MFGRKKRDKPAEAPRPRPVTVKCVYGCVNMSCATLAEAEVFRKNLQRCPQCGGELKIVE